MSNDPKPPTWFFEGACTIIDMEKETFADGEKISPVDSWHRDEEIKSKAFWEKMDKIAAKANYVKGQKKKTK